jgi:hypothetical protein
MSTPTPIPQFRPLTPKDMEEYEKELTASLATKDSPNENTPDEADPEEPKKPAKVEVSSTELEELKAYKKRFADQTTYLNEQIRLRKIAEKEKEDLLKQSAKKAYASDEEVADFESKVETSHILKELIRRQNEKEREELERKFEEKLTLKELESKKKQEDSAKLSKVHPDWPEYDIGGDLHNVFTGWLDKQPPTIQKLADYTVTQDIDGAIAVLTMFKAEVQVKKPTGPKTKQPASTNPSTRTPANIPEPKEGAFDVLAWDKAMDNAMRTGDRKLQDSLMADMQKARKEGRLTNY